jgi:hypothetical protein
MAGAALDLVEAAGVLHGLKSFGGGHEKRLVLCPLSNKDKPAGR